MKWNDLTKPKEEGGLGLRNLRDMNLAFMVKLGWRLVSEEEGVWRQVLISKYTRSEPGVGEIRSKRSASHIRQGMVKVRFILEKGVRKAVRNGVTTSFQLDKWMEAFPLHEIALNRIPDQDLQAKVVDY